MKIYMVGGAVRDILLGRPVRDRDHVVVDGTAETLLALGFEPVGKDFPIFLHPQTREEHALARGAGRGMEALLADLAARDLTINAMAMDMETGEVIDPWGGMEDLHARLLRPVAGFGHDPIRVLRAARFAARLEADGFKMSEVLTTAMHQQVACGALAKAHPDRVWLELSKALSGPRPATFLRALHACGALAVWLPEVDALYGVPQAAQWHPEIDTGIHTEMVLEMAGRLAPGRLDVAWSALTHDLGKALTPAELLPRHHGHEEAGLVPLAAVHARLPVPTACRTLAERVCELHLNAHTAFDSRAGTLHKLFLSLDAYRQPDRLNAFALACEADKRGRLGLTEEAYPQAAYLREALAAARAVRATAFVEQGLTGERMATAMRDARIRAINGIKHAWAQVRSEADAPAPGSRPRM